MDRRLVRRLGVDEHRFRRGRYLKNDAGKVTRVEPWSIVFTDLDTGAILDIVDGRRGQAVRDWIGAPPRWWRNKVDLVAMDTSSEFRRTVRKVLPKAAITVDHWHVVAQANQMVTEVRRRLGRQGTRPPAAEDRSHRRIPPGLGRARKRRESDENARGEITVPDPENVAQRTAHVLPDQGQEHAAKRRTSAPKTSNELPADTGVMSITGSGYCSTRQPNKHAETPAATLKVEGPTRPGTATPPIWNQSAHR